MDDVADIDGTIIPFEMRDSFVFDETFRNLKQRFAEETKLMDDVFSKMNCPKDDLDTLSKFEALTTPDGQARVRLQFDVSQYDPEDVKIQSVKNMLTITAVHEEKSANHSSFRQYHREYTLPPGIDPASIKAMVSRDGVLTLEIPLPNKPIESSQ